MDKSIYDLNLHEYLYDRSIGIDILRVAGGWIYEFFGDEKLFVPFNNEFMVKQLPEPTSAPSSGTPITLV
jgi:hypothetical protein